MLFKLRDRKKRRPKPFYTCDLNIAPGRGWRVEGNAGVISQVFEEYVLARVAVLLRGLFCQKKKPFVCLNN